MIYHTHNSVIIRDMKENDIEIILGNFNEQGWKKPREVIEGYFLRQNKCGLHIFIAEYNKDIAGYTVLYPSAKNGPFANKGIPEISDFIVFIKYQRLGIGNKILDAAEKAASKISDQVSLGVGLHSGYGEAQRIYAKRGYIPDGTGVWYRNAQLSQYSDCINDDDLVLFLCKALH